MKSVCYDDLKKGEYYAMFKNMSNKKLVIIFQTLDSKPVKETFAIIMIKEAWLSRINKFGNRFVEVRHDYVINLQPDAENIFQLTEDEIRSHIIIPQI